MIIKICTKANFEYIRYVYVYAKSLQWCPALCDLVDYNPPGSSVHGILQVGTLEWVVISFSRGLPDPGIKPASPALAGRFLPLAPPGKLIDMCARYAILLLPFKPNKPTNILFSK